MLKESVLEKLNNQIVQEAYSSNLYLSMSAWCSYNAFEGSASFLYGHAQEEFEHMRKLFVYIQETGSLAVIKKVEAPVANFKSILDVFEKTYAHEQKITKSINDLIDFVLGEKDYSTFNFLQWYVSEQHEEERLFRDILERIQKIGPDSSNIIFIDRYIGKAKS